MDEVNAKFTDLDPTLRQQLVRKFKYVDPKARYLPSVRMGRWDGSVAFFQMGGSTYINLLDEILPLIEAAGYEIEVDDRRDYKTSFDFDVATENMFAHVDWPEGHPLAGQPIKLRDYQVEVINTFLQNPQSLTSAATGSGKTMMTAAMSYSVERYGRSIVIVPSKSLVVQTEADYRNCGLDVGVYFGDRKEENHRHTICTWQSLGAMLKDTQEGKANIQEFIEGTVAVIVDEVHSAAASTLQKLLSGPFAKVPIRWGLTGTVPKEPYVFVGIKCVLGPVVGQLKASELQERGVLADCHIHIRQLQDHSEYKDYHAERKYLLNDRDRLHSIAEQIREISETGNTLVLIDLVEPGQYLTSLLPDAVFVNGSTKLQERKEDFAEFNVSDNKITVATFGVAAVGISIVRVHNLVLIEPGKSFVRVIQSIGRGLRKGFDKESVNIYDITSSCKFSKRHLSTRKKYYTDAGYPYTTKKIEWK